MRKIILLIGDLTLLYSALAITLWLRFSYINSELWYRHLMSFTVVFAVWVLVFFINGLYEIEKVQQGFKFYGTLVQNLVINTVLAIAFFYIVGDITGIKPQTILLILVGIFTIFFLLWRKIFYKLMSSDKLGSNLAIIGIHAESLSLAEEIIKKPQLGYKLKLIINPDSSAINEKINNVDVSRDISEMRDKILEHEINTVVAINDPKYSPEVARYLFENIDLKIQYFNLTDFYEKITGKIPVSSLERHWFLENITQKNQQWFNISKRIIDILMASFFGLLSLLILPFIALAIKLESKGPLIYKQKRVGLNNKVFTVYKLRSMAKNAEKNGAQWAKENDSRITKVGKFIRKTRIDEIPQFINILKGNMSFVGPRPERPEFVTTLKEEIPFYNERHLVKPGLSGWAQISFPYGASVDDAKQKLQYDLFYIKNQSIALDISIILKTINTVFNKSLGR
ncbi:MAG: sugar transferase [Candidatus Komeilibacteria bacterium]|jgi:exopolysaccharide biosynthesis polyprenyl glycosylphosphotransferase|nr:sugar transferase [Candidatus Komeilibacteria bacterium]MBT4448038.1 sugar transferase [Candidatus Komeilibacteria bacterium]